MGDFKGIKPGTVAKMLEMEEELARLGLLIKVYGLCHPDIQVARLTEEQAHEKLRETMLRENDPKMPAYKSREVGGK
jgi:hypothetical protein